MLRSAFSFQEAAWCGWEGIGLLIYWCIYSESTKQDKIQCKLVIAPPQTKPIWCRRNCRDCNSSVDLDYLSLIAQRCTLLVAKHESDWHTNLVGLTGVFMSSMNLVSTTAVSIAIMLAANQLSKLRDSAQ